jgi:hypothetical protein
MKKTPARRGRYHREDPERIEPKRSVKEFLGSEDSPSSEAESEEAEQLSDELDEDPDDEAMRATDRLFEDLDDERRDEGWFDRRRHDREPGGYSFLRGYGGGIERLIRLYVEALEFIVSVASSGPFGFTRPGFDHGIRPPQDVYSSRRQAFSIEFRSHPRLQAKLSLRVDREHERFFVEELRSSGTPKHVSIRHVTLVIENRHPKLTIPIRRNHPHGTYTGRIVNLFSRRERGLLSVRVG